MPQVYFKVGQVSTTSVRHDDRLYVAVPEAREPAFTATYGGQLAPNNNILATLGNSKKIVPYVTTLVAVQLNAQADEMRAQSSLQLNSLETKIRLLTAKGADRASLFSAFFEDVPFGAKGKISEGGDLSGKDVDVIVRAVYTALRTEKGATSRIKEGIRDYIRTGRVDGQVLLWLAENVSSVFGDISRYLELKARQQQQDSHEWQAPNELEQLVLQTLGAVNAGTKNYGHVDINGETVSLYPPICKILNAQPGPQFFCLINAVAHEQNRHGILVPFHYAAHDGSNLPEALKSHYMSVQEFTRIITVLSNSLARMLLATVADVFHSERDAQISDGLLMKGLLPGNAALDALYKFSLPGSPENAVRVARSVTDAFERGKIVESATARFQLDEGELTQKGLERLVNVIGKITPILPLPIYEFIAVHFETKNFKQMLAEDRKALEKEGLGGTPSFNYSAIRHNAAVSKCNELVKLLLELREKLAADFGVEVKTMINFDAETVEKAIRLFGEEFGFVRKVLSADTSVYQLAFSQESP